MENIATNIDSTLTGKLIKLKKMGCSRNGGLG
jgi:hypothetical protein